MRTIGGDRPPCFPSLPTNPVFPPGAIARAPSTVALNDLTGDNPRESPDQWLSFPFGQQNATLSSEVTIRIISCQSRGLDARPLAANARAAGVRLVKERVAGKRNTSPREKTSICRVSITAINHRLVRSFSRRSLSLSSPLSTSSVTVSRCQQTAS